MFGKNAMGHAKGEGNEVPLHCYPQLSCLRLGVGKRLRKGQETVSSHSVIQVHTCPPIPQFPAKPRSRAGSSTEQATAYGQGRSVLYSFSVCILQSTDTMFSVSYRETDAMFSEL